MYCIAEFGGVGEKKEIAVIHRNWILGQKTFWPPFWRESQLFLKALRNGHPPDPQTWALYDIRVIGNKYFGSYDEARKTLTTAQATSDLSADESVGRLRTRYQPDAAPMSDSSIEDDHHDNVKQNVSSKPSTKSKKLKRNHEMDMAPPPAFPIKFEQISTPIPTLVAVQSPSQSQTGHFGYARSPSLMDMDNTTGNSSGHGHIAEETVTNVPQSAASVIIPAVSGSSFDGNSFSFEALAASSHFQNTQSSRSPFALPQSMNFNAFGNNNGAVANVLTTSHPNHVPTIGTLNQSNLADTMKAIQTNQELLLAKADIAIDLLTTLLGGRRAARTVEGSNVNLSLPFTDLASFTNYNEQLKLDPTLRENLVSVLETTGGRNPNQVVYRVMAELMTDNLMVQHTLKGHTGKKSFKDTLFFSCVHEAVKRQPKGQSMSKKEVEDAMDYWLRKASTRIEKREKSTNKQNESSSSQLSNQHNSE